MQITQTKNTILKSQNFAETACSIDAEDARYIARLLRDNYSDPRWASVREIIANAVDACKEARNGTVPLVTAPTKFNPTFSVRDYGNGLTREQVIGNPDLNPIELAQARLADPLFGLYSKYGKSTKRNSNSGIGGFGIGRFAPLSYGDSFTVESFVNGTRTIYAMRIDEFDDTRISELTAEPTDEPNGLKVIMPVNGQDIYRFSQLIARLRAFGVVFTVKGMEMPKWEEKAPVTLQDKGWKLVNLYQTYREIGYESYYRALHFVVMGGVPYPLDINNLSDTKNRRFVSSLTRESLVLELPIGSVKLHHSRESLEYNEATKKVLEEAIQCVCRDVRSLMQEGIDSSSSFSQAVERYVSYTSIMSNVDLTWKGKKLSRYWNLGSGWDKSAQKYSYEVEVQSYTPEPANVTGMKFCRSHCAQGEYKSNFAILYDDLPSGQKGKNYARKAKYLLEEKGMKKVYLLRFKSGSRSLFEKKMAEQHFDDLRKSGNLFNISSAKEVAPMKTSSKSSKGNAMSLLGVHLFSRPSYSAKRSWEKVVLQSDIPAGKKYYVPIYNVNIVNLDGGYTNPYRMNKSAVMEFVGLDKNTPLLGLSPMALKRILKHKDASKWVDIRELVQKKIPVFLKNNPHAGNDYCSLSEGMRQGYLWSEICSHPELHAELRVRFEGVRNEVVTIEKELKKRKNLTDTFLAVCQSVGVKSEGQDSKKEKHSMHDEFFNLAKTYLPFAFFYRSYYTENLNDRIVSCLGDSALAKHAGEAVRMANAIFFQEQSK